MKRLILGSIVFAVPIAQSATAADILVPITGVHQPLSF
jgi:hypothetical protein